MSEKKILVVDDEENIRDVFEQAFSRAGYMVRLAESAEEALEILKDDKIQVMFLDLNLPGMNGVELCKQIRKDLPIAIIHAVTGYSRPLFEFSDCRDAGFDVCFNKPVKLAVLLEAAEKAFNKLDTWKKR
ncbi:MAG: response regulator [Deltaproteobacteria bacterium]|nr:response regulator [Deltaproteobacteria bacterium]